MEENDSSLISLSLERLKINEIGATGLSTALILNSYLISLDLRSNHINESGAAALSHALTVNRFLSLLDLGSNVIGDGGATRLSEALVISPTLRSLHLYNNEITEVGATRLSEALKANRALTLLDLGANSIKEAGATRLSEALCVNATLVELHLWKNHINEVGATRLSKALKLNSALSTLNLGYNNINANGVARLSRALATNSTLRALSIADNNISDAGAARLQAALAQNASLTYINLMGNPITEPRQQAIQEMLHLNQFLSGIDPVDLKVLFQQKTVLSFADRPILNTKNALLMPFQQFPRHFTTLDFRNNPQLVLIPPNLGHLDPSFTKTILFDAPSLLPSVRPFARDAPSIIRFAQAMLEGASVHMNQIKLMVVGREAAGKTALLRRFCGERYDPLLPSTDGIDLRDFSHQGMRFSTWDFGGNKVHRYTHQLFLGGSAIYLLVFKLTDSLAATLSELRYWLTSVTSRAVERPTVVLVGTHLDQAKRARIDSAPLIASLLRTLAQEYGTLLDFDQLPVFQVSCVPGGEDYVASVLVCLLSLAQRAQVRANKSFFVAEHYFSELQHLNPPVVSFHRAMTHLKRCFPEQSDDEIHQTLRTLADFDSLSLFHQPRTPSEGLIVLRPQWITSLFASLITTHHTFVGSESGSISREHIIQHIWKDALQYPPDKHDAYLHVLAELQVIFPFVERGNQKVKYFIPCRLREEPPDLTYHLSPPMLADHPYSYQREFRIGSALPMSVLPPLLIELLRKGELLARWQQGALARVVEPNGQSVWIHIGRRSAQSIVLHLWGQSITSCAPWLRSLSLLIENRLKEFRHLQFDIVMPCAECTAEGDRGNFSESTVHQAILGDRNLVTCDGRMNHLLRIDSLAPDLLYRDLPDDGFIFDYQRFEHAKTLGLGTFGQVALMSYTQHNNDDQWHPPVCSTSVLSSKLGHYTVKTFELVKRLENLNFSKKDIFLELKREVFLMSTLDHPFLLRLYGISTTPPAVVMEVAGGGDLYAQLTDPMGLRSKIFHFARDVRQHLAEFVEAPTNIHRAIYVIEKSSSLDPEALLILKQNCQEFLRSRFGILHYRGIDLNAFTCPLHLIMTLYESNPNDKILTALQTQYARNCLGLDQDAIRASLCPALLPLKCIGNHDAFQQAQVAFEDWKYLATLRGLGSDQIQQLAVAFFNSLETLHENPTLSAGHRPVDSIMDQIQALERRQRSSLVPISFPLQLKLAAEIVLSMVHLHNLQPPMVHRDLKTHNIFLTRSLIDFPIQDPYDPAWRAPLAKVADFGLSVRMVRSSQLQIRDRNDNDPLLNSDPTWSAPELLRGEPYTSASDVYAVGIILWELLVRETPFHEPLLEDDAIRSHILQGKRPLIPLSIAEDPQLTPYLCLMQRCWSHNPEDRPRMTEVYRQLMNIIESDDSTRVLATLLPSIQSIDAQEKGLPPKPFQIHPIDLPLAALQVKTKDELPHITCMIAPSLTEEFWFGFANGVVAHAKYEEQTLSLDVLACQEYDRHCSRVNAVIFCVGQGEDGTIWTGSEDGLMSVWSPQREECSTHSGSSLFQSHFLIYSGKSLAPFHCITTKLFRKRESRTHKYWVEFDSGNVSFFHSRSSAKPFLQLNSGSDIVGVQFQPETRQLFISHTSGDQLFVLTPLESDSPEASTSMMFDIYRHLVNFSPRYTWQSTQLKRLASRQFRRGGTGDKIGVQSLLALDHTVFCATHDFFISEWTLTTRSDSRGSHPMYSIEPCRSFQIDLAEIEPRFRVLLGFIRVNKRTLWLSLGNRWLILDLSLSQAQFAATRVTPDASIGRASLSTSSEGLLSEPSLGVSPSASASGLICHQICSSHDDQMISLLSVRKAHFDQIYSGDRAGRIIVWHPYPAPLCAASEDTAPLLIPSEHRIIDLAQTKMIQPPSPADALTFLSPDHLWLGTCKSDLISWNLSAQEQDDELSQPFHQYPHLRPSREIISLMNVKDSSGSPLVWCLSREKKFLRFSGLQSLYAAPPESTFSEFVVDVASLKKTDQPLYSDQNCENRSAGGHYFGQPVAIKMLSDHSLDTPALTRELNRWCTFRHPHLVTLIGYATKPDALIVLELMDCSLYQVIHHSQSPAIPDCLTIARGIASGLRYIHARQAVHRDLKSFSVLLRGYENRRQGAPFEVKLADLGFLNPIDPTSDRVGRWLCWSAPELFTSYATSASDVYSMGMVFYELFMRKIPFRHILKLDSSPSQSKAMRDELCLHKTRPEMTAQKMRLNPTAAQPIMNLISSCWAHEAHLRPTAASVLHQLHSIPFTELSNFINDSIP